MQTQADILQNFLGVKLFLLVVESHKLLFHKVIKVRHHGVVLIDKRIKVGGVINAISGIKFKQHYFDSVYLGISEILVCSKKVLEI